MPAIYEKTLTVIGVKKQVERFSDSIVSSKYKLDGVEDDIAIFKKVLSGNEVKIYIYFDDGIIGNIANVQLIDDEGDIIAEVEQEFTKESNKGLYILFKYKFVEEVITDEI